MKKLFAVLAILVLSLGLLAACGKDNKTETPTNTPTTAATEAPKDTPTEAPATPTEVPATPTPTEAPFDPAAKGEGVMTYAQYDAAADDDEIVIECFVQAHQSWWDNKITVYAADPDGGYFIYNMTCSEEDAAKLVPGTKIKVTGFRATWAGEKEVAADATFEILEGSYIAPAVDVTALLGTDELVKKQNQFVTFKNLTVVSAATYKHDGSGQQGDDLYFKVSDGKDVYTFTVESYLCGKDTDVYKAVEGLKAGDIVDLEGFLYWYNGVNPHITKATVTGSINAKSEGVMTHEQFVAAADDDEITIECYVQDHQSWWENKITVYAADADGGYFIYEMTCSEEDAAKLVPGTKIRVKGYRATWSGEIEVASGSEFEILEGSYIAPAVDLTQYIDGSTIVSQVPEVIAAMNSRFTLKGLRVTNKADYKYDGSGQQGDDLYLRVSLNGVSFSLVVESYLRGADTDVYKTVEALKGGDIIDVEGYLYWYNGAQPHLINVTVVPAEN